MEPYSKIFLRSLYDFNQSELKIFLEILILCKQNDKCDIKRDKLAKICNYSLGFTKNIISDLKKKNVITTKGSTITIVNKDKYVYSGPGKSQSECESSPPQEETTTRQNLIFFSSTKKEDDLPEDMNVSQDEFDKLGGI